MAPETIRAQESLRRYANAQVPIWLREKMNFSPRCRFFFNKFNTCGGGRESSRT
jgi:hypothetical protein